MEVKNTKVTYSLSYLVVLCLFVLPGYPGCCFTNVLQALQYILLKFVYYRNHTRTKFQLELLTINGISGFVYFHKIIF